MPKKKKCPCCGEWPRGHVIADCYHNKEWNRLRIAGLGPLDGHHGKLVRDVEDLGVYSGVTKLTWAPRWICDALDSVSTREAAERLLLRASRNPTVLRPVAAAMALGAAFVEAEKLARIRRKETTV